jgi:PAS domain S-box-containing protein
MTIKSTYLKKHFYNAGIAIALLILLSVVLLTYRLLHLTNEYGKWVVHTHHVIEHLQTLLTYVVDAETGQRGFIVTDEDAYLKPYNSALRQIDSEMVELKKLTKNSLSLQNRLDRIRILIDSKLAELALTIKVRQSAGFDSAQAMVKEEIDRATMDSIRTNIAIARNQETSLLRERTKNYQMYMHRLHTALFFGSITDILIFLAIIILLRVENDNRTRVEEELRNYQEHLNDLVKERSGELKASEQRWATTLASLADAVIVTDETGFVIFMNTIAESIIGQSVKETLHKPLSEVFNLISEGRRKPLDDLFTRLVRDGVVTDLADHTILVRKEGKEVPIECTASRMQQEDGILMGAVFIFRDITKQRQADEAMRDQAALLNLAHDAIIVRNAADEITFWNRGAEETYGWTQVEVGGRVTHDLLKTRFPLPLSEIKREAQKTGEWNGELIHTRKDGEEIVVASRWAVQMDIWGRHVSTLEINRDITVRKQAEEALRKSRTEALQKKSELETVIRSVPVGLALFNKNGSARESNEAFKKIMFYSDREIHLPLDKRIANRQFFDEAGALFEGHQFPFYRVLQGELVQNQVIRFTADGSEHWVSFNAAPIMIDGEITGFVGGFVDITEMKRAEQALRESERNFKQAQRIAHIGSWIWNVETGEVSCSAETYRIYGEEPFAFPVTLKTFFEYVHPEDREYVKKNIADLEAGHKNKLTIGFRIVHKDSTVRHIHTICEVMEFTAEGKSHIIRGTGQDITERKHFEEALRDSETRLKKALSIETMGVLFFTLDGHITGANATFERLSGYSSDELRGITHWKTLTVPEHWERTVKTAENLAIRGETPPYEKQMIRKGGSRWWGLFAPTRLSGSDINAECVEFIIDITERKEAEEALLHRTSELAAANSDLESFSYSVSHDLRNPLNTIGNFAGFLMEDYADRLDKEGQEYLRRINSGVKNMKTLIDDMLSLSRIGRQEIKKEDVNLSAITRNYLKELATEEPQRKDEIVVQDNVHADADPRLIHLALENLLRNAWKFTSKKEVTRIEFGTVPSTTLKHQLTKAGWPSEVEDQTVYFVKDNGAGFDAKFAGEIFEPFKRVHAQKEFGGTGVGLSIVQRVIGRHGGKVWAEGETGEGATFYFTLDGRS